MVKIRSWYLYCRKRLHRTQALLWTCGIDRCQMLCALGDSLCRDHLVTPTCFNGPLNSGERMHGEQLQYSNVMPGARKPAVLSLKMFSQLTELHWKAPIAVNIRMIQACRLPAKQGQIMHGIEYLLPLAVAPLVPSNGLAITDHLKSVHVGFYRDGLEGMATGNTVAVLLPGERLVLIDLTNLAHGRIKGVLRKRQRMLTFVAKTLTNCFTLAGNPAIPILLTALAQKEIQLNPVFDSGNGCCPLALQQLHPVLHVWLLVTAGRQAKQWLEVVVVGQPLPAMVQLPLPTSQDRLGNCLWIVPPQFPGYAIKKRQGFYGAVQNRLGLLAW